MSIGNTKIDNTKVVTLSYTLSVLHEEGHIEFVEKRDDSDPLEFVFGKGILLPKVEENLLGKYKGFQCQIKLKPEDAFGLRNEKLVSVYPIHKLPKGTTPQKGMKYQTQGPDGEVLSVIVTDVNEQEITLDGNHPLADAFVQFDLSVLKVRDAAPAEISSGQVRSSLLH